MRRSVGEDVESGGELVARGDSAGMVLAGCRLKEAGLSMGYSHLCCGHIGSVGG